MPAVKIFESLDLDPICHFWTDTNQRWLTRERGMSTRTQILIYILVLAVFDTIIPIPITALVLIHVLYQKPPWFREWVKDIYGS
jgi:hypothetical protein